MQRIERHSVSWDAANSQTKYSAIERLLEEIESAPFAIIYVTSTSPKQHLERALHWIPPSSGLKLRWLRLVASQVSIFSGIHALWSFGSNLKSMYSGVAYSQQLTFLLPSSQHMRTAVQWNLSGWNGSCEPGERLTIIGMYPINQEQHRGWV
jgi:hypothetical protein